MSPSEFKRFQAKHKQLKRDFEPANTSKTKALEKKKSADMKWHKPDSHWESMESKMKTAHEIHNQAK